MFLKYTVFLWISDSPNNVSNSIYLGTGPSCSDVASHSIEVMRNIFHQLSPLPNGENKEEETEENGQHGGLVKKILETKKELETSAAKGHAAGRKRTEIVSILNY